MRLREHELDPRIRRELNAVDAALRGERVEPEFDDLAAIAAELREARPALDRDVAAELDEWAAKGFPRAGGAPSGDGASEPPRRVGPRTGRGRSRRRWLLPAFGAAATAVLVIGIAVSQRPVTEDQSLDSAVEPTSEPGAIEPGDVAPGASDAAAPVPGQGARARNLDRTSVLPGEPVPGGDLKPGRERVQEVSASLTLSTDPDELADVSDGVVAVTDRYEGFVVSSDVSTGDGSNGRASFDLRIPSQNLQAALADLSDLAHVKSRDEGTRDITEPFVTAGERFRDARAEVTSLLEQLADADDPIEIEAIRAQLRTARAELAAARAQLSEIKQRATFSIVAVAVVSEGDGPGWSLGEAADDAVNVLEAIGGAILVSLAVIIPIGALAAALWFGTATLRRRRRESVLDD